MARMENLHTYTSCDGERDNIMQVELHFYFSFIIFQHQYATLGTLHLHYASNIQVRL